jgi:hypothetical protein
MLRAGGTQGIRRVVLRVGGTQEIRGSAESRWDTGN